MESAWYKNVIDVSRCVDGYFLSMSDEPIIGHGRIESCRLALKDAVLNIVGRTMNWVHSPAMLKPFEYVDPTTDETLYLYTDKRLSVLCIGDRRYYFDRITGKFDGVLSSMVDISGRVELAD